MADTTRPITGLVRVNSTRTKRSFRPTVAAAATATIVALTLLAVGCSTTSNLMGRLPGARDDLLRDQVESDNFPNASQAGL